MFSSRFLAQVDDYREAYWWLRDNTPEDARVLSWWDYGYQISGIGERTTLADGPTLARSQYANFRLAPPPRHKNAVLTPAISLCTNRMVFSLSLLAIYFFSGNTWNHEHIATLGKILTANVKNSHRMARHLADYVLVWAGGGAHHLFVQKNATLAFICFRIRLLRQAGTISPNPRIWLALQTAFSLMFAPATPLALNLDSTEVKLDIELASGDEEIHACWCFAGGMPTPMMEESLLYALTQYGIKPGVELDSSRYKHVYTSKYGKCR